MICVCANQWPAEDRTEPQLCIRACSMVRCVADEVPLDSSSSGTATASSASHGPAGLTHNKAAASNFTLLGG